MAEITRDDLLARRAALANEEKLAWANLNAVLGAIQDCDLWLAHLALVPPRGMLDPHPNESFDEWEARGGVIPDHLAQSMRDQMPIAPHGQLRAVPEAPG